MKIVKTWFVRLASLMALCVLVAAQETPAPQSQSQEPQQGATRPSQAEPPNTGPKIAPGSVIPVQLAETLDAKKVKPGDEVTAKVTQDMKTVNGQVLMPKDTRVVGHVTDAQPHNKAQKESQLGIAFDHAVMTDGTVATLPLSIQAVIAPPNQRPGNDNSAGGAMGGMNPGAGEPRSGGGRSGGMGGAQQASPSYPPGAEGASTPGRASEPRPPITANTEGMVGMPNYSLSSAEEASQGSVVSSEKETVKLERGTLMLLRVNQ